MKYVIPGGTGHVGASIIKALTARGDQAVVITRGGSAACKTVNWDGRSLGAWAEEIDGADVVLNLAGRTVNCRYTEENLRQMMDSRVESTAVVGQAIAAAKHPPKVWLQMSTATIYAHRFDAANDEATGVIGGQESDAPAYWKRSIDIALAWEATLAAALTPQTRQVALRTAMVMSKEPGSVLDVLVSLVRRRLGGSIAGGSQYISWIHEADFLGALDYLVAHDELNGAVNLASPGPIPQREFMAMLRSHLGVRIGLPATRWMAKLGAMAMSTDTELVLKSRRVVPRRLLEAGFVFRFPSWESALRDLVPSTGVAAPTR